MLDAISCFVYNTIVVGKFLTEVPMEMFLAFAGLAAAAALGGFMWYWEAAHYVPGHLRPVGEVVVYCEGGA